MSSRMKNIVCCICALFAGAALYILLRPDTYIATALARFDFLVQLQDKLKYIDCDFLRFYFPDFLWAFSLSCSLQAIFAPMKTGTFLCCIAALLCGTVWELFQYFGVIKGTGDWVDVLMYALAAFASVIIQIKEKVK